MSQASAGYILSYYLGVNIGGAFLSSLVVDCRRLPHFPTKMTLVCARALLSIEKISLS